jgi:hypothetical protein
MMDEVSSPQTSLRPAKAEWRCCCESIDGSCRAQGNDLAVFENDLTGGRLDARRGVLYSLVQHELQKMN